MKRNHWKGGEKVFETERAFYKANEADWLKHYEGQFVVIKGEEFVGAYPNDAEAYKAGLQKFGNVPFLIQRVTKEKEVLRFPALAVGVMYASIQ